MQLAPLLGELPSVTPGRTPFRASSPAQPRVPLRIPAFGACSRSAGPAISLPPRLPLAACCSLGRARPPPPWPLCVHPGPKGVRFCCGQRGRHKVSQVVTALCPKSEAFLCESQGSS